MPRFRVRTQMIAVAVVAFLMAAVGPARRWHRVWSYHRSEAARFARMEARERLNQVSENRVADREAVRQELTTTTGFAERPAAEQERIIDGVVEFHRHRAAQSLAAAQSWAEKRRDSETASFWAFDPFAPDVP